MASNQAPIVDRIRIIPRPDDFLDRNVGNSGEVFFDKQSNTLRLYSGNVAGGFTVLTESNLKENLFSSGVATVEYTVTVGTDPDGIESGNKYFIDGVYKPELNLIVGYTYIFNQNDPTNEYFPNPTGGDNNQHPLNFSADNLNGEIGGGTNYITNVVYKLDNDPVSKDLYWSKFANATQRSVQITITNGTPTTLYYWCQQHLNMGNSITTALPGSGSSGASIEVSETVPTSPDPGAIWFNSTTGRIYVYIEDVDSSQWVQPTFNIPSLLTDLGIADGTNGQVLTTDGSGNFTFQDATGDSVGNFTFSSSIITTDDSSTISITPAVTMASDLTVQNDLYINNVLYADSFVSTSTGTPIIDSASTITLNAPDGLIINGTLNSHIIPSGTGTLALTSDIPSISSLPDIVTDIAGEDLLKIVDDPLGNAIDKRVTISNLFANIPGALRLANLTTTERNALTPSNGYLIYNTTDNRLQGYQNGAWINIDDGSAA